MPWTYTEAKEKLGRAGNFIILSMPTVLTFLSGRTMHISESMDLRSCLVMPFLDYFCLIFAKIYTLQSVIEHLYA